MLVRCSFPLINDTPCSSEIHEKMCCNRCPQPEVMSNSTSESNYMNEGCRLDEEDIGGFAGIAGCFNSLKSHEKQVSEVTIVGFWEWNMFFCSKNVFLKVGTPKEEDLASWGHHHFPSSVPDCIFQASAGDEVRISSETIPAFIFFHYKVHECFIDWFLTFKHPMALQIIIPRKGQISF